MRVWLDPAKLVGYQMSPADVTNAIRQQNMLVSAGILGGPPNQDSQRVAAPITVNGQLATVEEFENIILRSQPDGSTVRIKDVARVEVGADNYQFGARLNSKPTAAFAISLLPEANALDTAAAIKVEMEKLAEFFPENIRYDIPYDTSPYVDKSITQVVYTLLEAMVLVFIVM
jgi:multidrug efflux pump